MPATAPFARVAAGLLLASAPAWAADILVQPGQSIQAAIDQAMSGDRILVEPGTYLEAIRYKGKAIEIVALGGPTVTTIDATGLFKPVVSFHLGEGRGSRLSGFTITGGNSAFANHWGGGISCRSNEYPEVGSPTVTDCVIRGNRANMPGGGVGGGSPLLERCLIVENYSSPTSGGGVAGSAVLRDCVVAWNEATDGYGGGVAFYDGGGRLERCVVQGNVSWQSARGGGVWAQAGASAEIVGSAIVDNFADGLDFPPGALYDGLGGAVMAEPTSNVVIEFSTIVGNLATASYSAFPNPVGGIYGPVTVVGCIVRGNDGAELQGVPGPVVSFSNVEGGAPGQGNIDADPLFVHPHGGDLHLTAGSPCIDAGPPGVLDPDGSPADQGAHPYRPLYRRSNLNVTSWEQASWSAISLQAGGQQHLAILAGGEHAGKIYLTLGSLSGTSPGTPLLGQVLPLNPDGYLVHTALHPGAFPLSGSLGVLAAGGRGETTLALPAGSDPALGGLTAWHATLVLETSPVLAAPLVTNAEPVELVP